MSEPLAPARRIRAILPDDGTDRQLLEELHAGGRALRVHVGPLRAVAGLQDPRRSRRRLPPSRAARVVTVIAEPAEADALFEWICRAARIGRPGGGMVMMDRVLGATRFELPPAMPPEHD